MSKVLFKKEFLNLLYGDYEKGEAPGLVSLLHAYLKNLTELIKKYNSLNNTEIINKDIFNSIISKWEESMLEFNSNLILAVKSNLKSTSLNNFSSFFNFKGAFDLFSLLFKENVKNKISFNVTDLLNKDEIFINSNEIFSLELFEEKSKEYTNIMSSENTILLVTINNLIKQIFDINNTIMNAIMDAYISYLIYGDNSTPQKK